MYPFFFGDYMISILMTPCGDTKTFEKQVETVETTIGTEYEIVCTLVQGDPMLDWFVEYCQKKTIRCMKVPDLGYTVLTNILAARAHGDYLYYLAPNTIIDPQEKEWGKAAISLLPFTDKIGGVLLSLKPNDLQCNALLLTQKAYCVLGYYTLPLFETSLYGTRWNASILTELKRLVNMPCGIQYGEIANTEGYATDKGMYDVTRIGRMNAMARLQQFMEADND